MHFVMSVFSNYAVVLHNVTPIDLLDQLAVLSDGVVVACLHRSRSYKNYEFRSRNYFTRIIIMLTIALIETAMQIINTTPNL